jgi:uncharacterized protein YdeI (YjbR/CyaY-like superfamily)
MININPNVDKYITDGCGRCSYFGTPKCKVHTWEIELVQLRRIILDSGLTEEYKWSQPCYTFQKKNILIMTAFKEYCALNFFKGALLKDIRGILIKPGENTQSGRQIRFTSVKEIRKLEPVLKAYILEAIEVEKKGLKVELKNSTDYKIPDELQKKFEENPKLKSAFEKLTPGRQRAYILYFTQPKQSKTRESRIEKYIPKILSGKGLLDDYKR